MGKQLSVRVPDWLYEALSKEAATEERSIGGQVRHLLGLHYVSKGYEEGQEEEAE